jgi:ABC-type multidrug transport system ATPase subunit
MIFLNSIHDSMLFIAPVLPSVDFDVKPGQLVAVVGQVGSGKSSLIQALLGEMEKHGGNVALRVHCIDLTLHVYSRVNLVHEELKF